MRVIEVIDSHTEGEPTRVVVAGLPDLGPGSARERMEVFRRDHDAIRSALIREPRGFDAMVGAALLEPNSPDAVAQVIFFNNVGFLNMCVHGTLGVGRTLQHLGRIGPGRHRLETPVGEVFVILGEDGSLSVDNVESRRHAKDLVLRTERHGEVVGDIAWGGNWFYLVHTHDQRVGSDRLAELAAFSRDVEASLRREGVATPDGLLLDHVEVFGEPTRADADSKNYVLCPGGEYDRSPCGTGTSAKLACLAADGKLEEGEVWRQESVIGSLFEGRIRRTERGVVPRISGGVWITGEARLFLDPADPYRHGILL
ncbi:MAG: proline racemase family protein [Planctomycetota bacterium]